MTQFGQSWIVCLALPWKNGEKVKEINKGANVQLEISLLFNIDLTMYNTSIRKQTEASVMLRRVFYRLSLFRASMELIIISSLSLNNISVQKGPWQYEHLKVNLQFWLLVHWMTSILLEFDYMFSTLMQESTKVYMKTYRWKRAIVDWSVA